MMGTWRNAADVIEEVEEQRDPVRVRVPAGPPPPPTKPATSLEIAERDKIIRQLRREGVPAATIAARYGISSVRVYQIAPMGRGRK